MLVRPICTPAPSRIIKLLTVQEVLDEEYEDAITREPGGARIRVGMSYKARNWSSKD